MRSMAIPLIIGAFFLSFGEAGAEPMPVVVELFTSQSCSSCPPAESNLRKLAQEDNIIALEWHVDYWDNLVAGRSGKWKDPFSSPAYTVRQRAYNVALRGKTGVYTPQVIINGAAETVGSYQREIRQLIDSASVSSAFIKTKHINGQIQFVIEASTSEAILVRFHKSAFTRVQAGENQGDELAEVNVVTGFTKLGVIKNTNATFHIDLPEANDGCALLVQELGTGHILGAAYCPS